MSHGINFLLALCASSSGMQDYIHLSPGESDFKGDDEKTVFEFVTKHASKYGQLPALETIKEANKKQGWGISSFPASLPEPPAFYYDKLRQRGLHLALKSAVQDVSGLLNAGNVDGALSVLTAVTTAQQMKVLKNRLVNYAAEGADMITQHLKTQAQGLVQGLYLGWPYFDGMSGGLLPGDVLSIIGRPAQGKTWALLHGAMHGWRNQGRVPLVVSMEMNAKLLMMRMAAMDAKINMTHLKMGTLDKTKQLKPMMVKLTANKGMQPLYVVDGALAVNVPQIKMLMQQLHPTDLWIDGAYLLRHENNKLGRWEKVTDNAERIKGELAEGFGIPAVISYQFNREAVKKKAGAPGVEDIGYTDAIGQLSSVVLGMMQAESVETLNRRKISILKGRSGEVGEFCINWQFQHPNAMDFSQWVEPSISELSYV